MALTEPRNVASTASADEVRVYRPLVARPPRPRELWKARQILYFMVVRDLKARYAQTVLGATWTIFQPLAMLGVYTYAFSRFSESTGGVPFTLFVLAGVALWLFVARGVVSGASSLVASLALVTRTACPRLVIPLASVCSSCVDLVVGLGLFVLFGLGYGVQPTWRLAFAPLVVALAFVLVLALSILLSALEVRYRDVGRILPWLVQLWFFLSPVALTLPKGGFTGVLEAVNPLVGILDAFRWSVLATHWSSHTLFVSVALTAFILVLGLEYFARVELVLADDL